MSKTSIISLVAVAVAALVLVLVIQVPRQTKTPAESVSKNTDNSVQPSTLPIPKDNPGVLTVDENYSPTLIRYTFSGRIESIIKSGSGTKLTLDVSKYNLPEVLIDSETRISRISYNPTATTKLTLEDLKKGLVVDITMDYEKQNRHWFLRDIYVPADRNP